MESTEAINDDEKLLSFSIDGNAITNYLRMFNHLYNKQTNQPQKYLTFRESMSFSDEIENQILDETHKLGGDSIKGYTYSEDDHSDGDVVYLTGKNVNILEGLEIIFVDDIDQETFEELKETYDELEWERSKTPLSISEQYLQNEKDRMRQINKYEKMNMILAMPDEEFKIQYGKSRIEFFRDQFWKEIDRLGLSIDDAKDTLPEFKAMQSIMKTHPFQLIIPNALKPLNDSGYISPLGKYYRCEAYNHIALLDIIKELHPEYHGKDDDILQKAGWLKMSHFQYTYNSDLNLLDNSKLLNFIVDTHSQYNRTSIVFNEKRYASLKDLFTYLEQLF